MEQPKCFLVPQSDFPLTDRDIKDIIFIFEINFEADVFRPFTAVMTKLPNICLKKCYQFSYQHLSLSLTT